MRPWSWLAQVYFCHNHLFSTAFWIPTIISSLPDFDLWESCIAFELSASNVLIWVSLSLLRCLFWTCRCRCHGRCQSRDTNQCPIKVKAIRGCQRQLLYKSTDAPTLNSKNTIFLILNALSARIQYFYFIRSFQLFFNIKFLSSYRAINCFYR